MLEKELTAKVNSFRSQKEAKLNQLRIQVESLLPVLEDHGLKSMARELYARIEEIKDIEKEIDKFMGDNLEQIVNILIKSNRGEP